ncbi:MAG: DinB family protein, partial [Actinomycetota bacterium]
MTTLTTAAVLASAVKQAHWLLDATFGDVDDDLAGRPAPGNANPLGTAYAHVVHAEDAVVNGLLQGRPPLWASTHSGKTGVDRLMPMPGMVEGDMGEWFRGANVAVDQLRAYAADVFAATEAYVASLDDEALGRG